MTVALRRTPLFDLIAQQTSKFTAFAGWEMPIQFSGLKPEHEAVRQTVGVFDISHMGKFEMIGPGAIAALQTLVPTDLNGLTPGRAQYTVLLNDQGGIVDDIIIYHQGQRENGEERITLIVNGATTQKDKDWLQTHLPPSLQFIDLSPDKILLALQGPQAIAVLETYLGETFADVPAFGHRELTWQGETVFMARTGYTGEDGCEVMVSPEMGQTWWQYWMAQGVTPCGLGARDTLRLEAAMRLYGQDMDDHTTPLEAGLGWLVHLDKGEFIGRDRLAQQKNQGLPQRLVGLQMQSKAIARHDYPLTHQGQPIGKITSGTLSPTLNTAIALGYVPPDLGKIGQGLQVSIRGKSHDAVVVKTPFYRRSQ